MRAATSQAQQQHEEAEYFKTKALGAIEIGVEQGDPGSHFNLAVLHRVLFNAEYGEDWLFHMTKAAASGHYKAAYELGRYYADAPAKRLVEPDAEQSTGDDTSSSSEDSADTQMKAPADTAPKTPTQPPPTTFTNQILHFLTTAFLKPTIDLDERSQKVHNASFPQDPIARLALSKEWLNTASRFHYPPANLVHAHLSLQRYILPSENLSQELNQSKDDEIPENGVPNPYFDVWLAHDLLAKVFIQHRIIKVRQLKKSEMTDAEHRLKASYAQFSEVLEDYVGRLDELLDEAKQLADDVGIDVTTDLYGLIYKHRGVRGQGSLEFDRVTPNQGQGNSRGKAS